MVTPNSRSWVMMRDANPTLPLTNPARLDDMVVSRLEVEDPLGVDAARGKVEQGGGIASQTAEPIDTRFGKEAAHHIGNQISPHQSAGQAWRDGLLTQQVDRIGDLRI